MEMNSNEFGKLLLLSNFINMQILCRPYKFDRKVASRKISEQTESLTDIAFGLELDLKDFDNYVGEIDSFLNPLNSKEKIKVASNLMMDILKEYHIFNLQLKQKFRVIAINSKKLSRNTAFEFKYLNIHLNKIINNGFKASDEN